MENGKYGFVEEDKIPKQQTPIASYEMFSHKTGGLTFLLALLLPQIIGVMALSVLTLVMEENSDPYLFFAYFITQAVMGLSVLVAVNFKLKELLPRLHCNKAVKKADYFLMLPLSFVLIFGLNFLPAIFLTAMQELGYVMQEVPFPDTTTLFGFIAGVVCICIVPAIVEESIFRGVILRSFSQKSAWKGILISSALFALMHGSAQQTVYQFVVGIFLALVAIKSNSIYPSMLLHMLNNVISLLILFMSEEASMNLLMYAMIPSIIGVLLLFQYYKKRETPCIEEFEEKIQQGSVAIKDGNGNLQGMSRDVTQSVDFVRRGRRYQAIIFYSSGILFGIFTWVTMMLMGF